MTIAQPDRQLSTPDWERFARLARPYRWRAPPGDEEDLTQDIILEMATVALRRNGRETPDAYLRGVARRVVAAFWRRRYPRPLSLYRPLRKAEGVELWETLAAGDGDPAAALEARELEEGKTYRRRKAAGRCPRCGGQPQAGRVHCAGCLARHRVEQARWRRRRQRSLRQRWKREGRCTRCGNPPEPGGRRCAACLARNRQDLQRWRQRSRALAHLRQAVTYAAQVLTWDRAVAEVERLAAEAHPVPMVREAQRGEWP